MLESGTAAPEISSIDQNGAPFRLSELRGHWVALYFYPKDDTPGCTAEACAFRDNMESLTKLGLTVVGVSTQDAESHQKFARKYNLAFHLVADPQKEVTGAYDSLGAFGMAKRVTYLIDPQGTIRDVYESGFKPTSHVTHVRDFLAHSQ
ncbi:MAG: peroxiredoxin [Candidatus Thermoplasmatota archaeon]|jgi:peroxiredoxin Q/BCP|nr:peroxiredoxin [Candidatus Thermoplasmatota archaeon]MCL5984154.1 peroxiredoxin [Candidatus Thermoplasmatota archaeon]